MLRNFLINSIEIVYIYIIKPLLFLLDPEFVHDNFIKLGKFLSKYKILNMFLALCLIIMIKY